MSANSDALATLNGYSSLKMEGASLRADIARVLQDATVNRSIDGASTLEISLYDDAKKLLRSGILSQRIRMQVETNAFELVQVRKSGNGLTLTLEDLPIAALRRRDQPYKVAAGTMTHVEFAKKLVGEERWLRFEAPVPAREKSKGELARGNPADPKADKVDSWTALGQVADARGWRRMVKNPTTILYVPETYLASLPAAYKFTEGSPGVDGIDFDIDTGKPVATAKVRVRAARWAVPVATAVQVFDMGPANGKWIVSAISRSLFSESMDVTISRPRPVLPEPEPAAPDVLTITPAPASVGTGGTTGVTPSGTAAPASGKRAGGSAALSKQGFMWPLGGTITSEYGMRKMDGPSGTGTQRLHAGIDIAVPVGTIVMAAKMGTVIYAGEARGYGYVVYMRHEDNVVTRYGHLSRIDVRAGQVMSIGGKIGLSGGAKGAVGAGDSTGPHLHFEVRPNDIAVNPRKYLP